MLYIMRHGKTDWNALHKLQGRTDIPLNEEGRLMALKAHEEYKSWNIDVCYCSPLIRAVETAQIVLKNRGIPIITDERLVEMSFGDYEGIENSFKIPDCPINLISQTGGIHRINRWGGNLCRAFCENRFLSEGSNRASIAGRKGYSYCWTWRDEFQYYMSG